MRYTRYATAAQWSSVNPILLQGEIGVEDDTSLAKVGDGSTRWADLDYMAADAAAIVGVLDISKGGTGQTDAQKALNALTQSEAGDVGRSLVVDAAGDTVIGWPSTYLLEGADPRDGAVSIYMGGSQRSPMAMGEISITDNSTATVITTSSTWTRFDETTANGVADRWDSPSAGRLRYIGDKSIVMHMGCTISMSGATANDITAMTLIKNATVNGSDEYSTGTILDAGQVVRKLGGAGDVGSAAIHVMQTMTTNDYVELFLENRSGTGDLTVTDMNLFAMGYELNVGADVGIPVIDGMTSTDLAVAWVSDNVPASDWTAVLERRASGESAWVSMATFTVGTS